MKNTRKLIASIVISGMACQMMPMEAMAAQLNRISPPEAFGAVPNASQLQYQEEELAAFIHFGMNTFTNSEWGNGSEDPNNFNPTDLNVDEWVSVLKDAGFKRLIMVAKHHDGFCLWPSEYTEHDIESSTDWQNASGGSRDFLAELSEACTKYDMDMGIYLSPWDVNAESYGYGAGTNDETDTNGDYNEYYMNQLKEILGNPKYGNNGKFVEVWMDGAKGSGAAAQNYKFLEWFDLIEELQPGAVVFSPYATGVRWIGNESGKAGDPVWSKINTSRIRDRYDNGQSEENYYLNSGDANGDIWSVGECDVSLTSGWFWHNGNGPKTMEQLTDIYFSSVGRGQPLLLNVAPDNTGNFTAADIARLQEFSAAVNNTFDENLALPETTTAEASSTRGNSKDYSADNVLDDDDDSYWTMDDGQTTGSLTIDLGGEKRFDVVSIEEYIKLGQRVSEFSVEVYSNGAWKNFGEGYTIGAKRLVRGTPVTASKVKINIENSLAVPLIENVEVYKADKAFEVESIAPEGTQFIDNTDFENKNAWIQESIGIGNTGMWTSNAGTYSSFTFKGTKAWVIGTLDPNHGIMEVWIDGEKVDEVDTYKSQRKISQIIYSTDDLEYGAHTVKIVVKGDKNQNAAGTAIGLDGAYYLDNNAAGMFEIENVDYTVNEGSAVDVTIKRVGGTSGPAAVHFSTSPDSAVHGRHYNDVNTIVEFADGEATKTISVSTIDNTEAGGNVSFLCNIDTPTNGALIGFNKASTVTIIDNDIDTVYTEDNPFVFPGKLNEKKVLEAELFTLESIEGDKYVRISEDENASNGKIVSWFEPGNKIKVPFNAPKSGTYTFNMTYQSGRSEGNLNNINWSGTNVVSGSKSVPGTGSQDPIPYIKTSFDVEITEAGPGELIFTADGQASPNIDVFEVVPKELAAESYTINASAGANGTISPEGNISLEEGSSQQFKFTPDDGYEVEDVLVDGVSVGAVTEYTVDNVSKDTTILVTFKEIGYGKNNPVNLTDGEVTVEAETLELDGVGGEIENKNGASNGKVIGWLGKTSRGNAWLNMWVNSQAEADYEVEVRYFAGANNVLYYENLDGSISGSIDCPNTNGSFNTTSFTVELNSGLDRIKFFNDDNSTANIDTIKITKVSPSVDKSGLSTTIEIGKNIIENESDKYTEGSITNLKDILEIAEGVLADENADQDQVNTAKEALEGAISSLVEAEKPEVEVDKSALKITIDYANELKESGELEGVVLAVVEEFNKALSEAEVVFNNKQATESEVKSSFDRLSKAIQMLEFKAGDKSALQNLVDAASALNKDNYTEESWEAVKSILVEANKVLEDVNAMQDEIDEVHERLQSAIEGLEEVEKVDKTILQGFVDKVGGLDSTKYIESTWTPFEAALENANLVLANDKATQVEVNEVYKTLLKAYLDLRLVPDKSLLEDLIKSVEGLDLSKFTDESVEALKKALSNAKAVLENEEVSVGNVNLAVESLRNARNSLVENTKDQDDDTDKDKDEDKDKDKDKDEDEAKETDEAKENNNGDTGSSGSDNNKNQDNGSQTGGNSNGGNTNTGKPNGGQLPQTGTAGVAGTLLSGVLALIGGITIGKSKKK